MVSDVVNLHPYTKVEAAVTVADPADPSGELVSLAVRRCRLNTSG